MASGIKALIAAAKNEPLRFFLSMYCGEMIVTGRVAPSGWWYEVTEKAFLAEAEEAIRRYAG